MRIITRVVIDIETLQVIEEESFDYSGPIAECKGGGGSTSGEVGYPDYMEDTHSEWLNDSGSDEIAFSMVDAMNSALGSSPWVHQIAYDPSADINDWELALDAFKTLLAGLSDITDWTAFFNQANTSVGSVIDTEVEDAVDAFADQLDDDLEAKVLPRFRRGMHDINAVVSSAYVIGEALLEAFRTRDIAKYGADIRISFADKSTQLVLMGTEQMAKMMQFRLGLEEGYVKSIVESNRIKIVAKSEHQVQESKYDEADALWDLKVFEYGGNLLASIGGATVQPSSSNPSMAQSVLGGAMSGAAAGAMIPGIGPLAGGIIGAASAFL